MQASHPQDISSSLGRRAPRLLPSGEEVGSRRGPRRCARGGDRVQEPGRSLVRQQLQQPHRGGDRQRHRCLDRISGRPVRNGPPVAGISVPALEEAPGSTKPVRVSSNRSSRSTHFRSTRPTRSATRFSAVASSSSDSTTRRASSPRPLTQHRPSMSRLATLSFTAFANAIRARAAGLLAAEGREQRGAARGQQPELVRPGGRRHLERARARRLRRRDERERRAARVVDPAHVRRVRGAGHEDPDPVGDRRRLNPAPAHGDRRPRRRARRADGQSRAGGTDGDRLAARTAGARGGVVVAVAGVARDPEIRPRRGSARTTSRRRTRCP